MSRKRISARGRGIQNARKVSVNSLITDVPDGYPITEVFIGKSTPFSQTYHLVMDGKKAKHGKIKSVCGVGVSHFCIMTNPNLEKLEVSHTLNTNLDTISLCNDCNERRKTINRNTVEAIKKKKKNNESNEHRYNEKLKEFYKMEIVDDSNN